MKRTLITIFILCFSIKGYSQYIIPYEGTHLTISNYNEFDVDKKLFNKDLTLDVIVDRLDHIANGNKPATISYDVLRMRWTKVPYSNYDMFATDMLLARPGEYAANLYHNANSSLPPTWTTNVKVAFRGDPVVSATGFNGFLSDIAKKKADKWIIESNDPVELKVYPWFDGQTFTKGKNDLYSSTGELIASNKLNHTLNSGEYKLVLDDRYSDPQIINIEIKSSPTIATQPASQSLTEGQTLNLLVEATGGDLQYQWYKDGSIISGATGATYSVSNITIDETGKYKCEVKNPRGSTSSNEVSVKVTYNKPVITTQPIAQTLNESENLSLTVVADGKGLSYQWQKSGTNIAGATSATYYKPSVNVNDAAEYQCLITNSGGSVKSNLVKIAINVNMPTITTNPKSQELVENENLTLSIEASGSGLTYQWKKDNNIISGATNSIYSKPNIGVEDQGVYSCTVSNQAGTVTSSNVTITIKNAVPVITVQPQSQDLTLGSTLNLSVDAIGSGLSYQWKKDGTPIAGATSSSYSKTNISASEDGAYVCVITNSGGLTTSDIATIKIVAIAGIPIFDGLKEEYVVGDSPVTLKITGTNADIFKNFKVNGVNSIQFNPDKAGVYEIEVSTEDGKTNFSTYVIVK